MTTENTNTENVLLRRKIWKIHWLKDTGSFSTSLLFRLTKEKERQEKELNEMKELYAGELNKLNEYWRKEKDTSENQKAELSKHNAQLVERNGKLLIELEKAKDRYMDSS